MKIYSSEDSHAVPIFLPVKGGLGKVELWKVRQAKWRKFGYLYRQQSK